MSYKLNDFMNDLDSFKKEDFQKCGRLLYVTNNSTYGVVDNYCTAVKHNTHVNMEQMCSRLKNTYFWQRKIVNDGENKSVSWNGGKNFIHLQENALHRKRILYKFEEDMDNSKIITSGFLETDDS